ncbi:MAG: hypothetical protein P1R58_06525 [bacterium]|nr:hypothetical protein [bacterium]
MWKRFGAPIGVFLLFLLILTSSSLARLSVDANDYKGIQAAAAAPADCITVHKVGRISLSVTNTGNFGNNEVQGTDCLTGEATTSCEYPKGSGIEYLFLGAFWIGAVSGRDTLVTTGADGWLQGRETFPDEGKLGELIHRSLIDPTSPEFDGAVSENDVIAVYRDTLTAGVPLDDVDNRPHQPLFLKVDESSYSWSYSYAEDFVLFDYKISNEGFNRLDDVYMGIYVDADVGQNSTCQTNECHTDDICGFVHATPETTRSGCTYTDTVNIAWIADNDGDPGQNGPYDNTSATNVTATRIVRTPSEKLEVSFNWWISNGNATLDFGPREKAGQGRLKEDLYPYSHGGLGTPNGDRAKYYVMRNQEFDYDQILTANIQQSDPLWLAPNNPAQALSFADGFDTRYLLSFGPFKIDPGETLPLSFAYVAGENFHTNINNAADYLDNQAGNYDPLKYYANLNFEDLTTNARWASWIYDNPGVDTDGSGFRGKFIECLAALQIDTIVNGVDTTFDTLQHVVDTTYLTGDGVPDFQGAKPPPAPVFWIQPEVGKLTIRFNGLRSENTPDEFLKVTGESPLDFEGYRVYYGRDERDGSYSLFASYDREDYNKYVLTQDAATGTEIFVLYDTPYTIEQLQTLYGDPADPTKFDPLVYSRTNPYLLGDSVFYFAPQDYNTSEFGVTTDIFKIYPDQPYPSTLVPEDANEDELTKDGYLKYFEYSVVIPDLLPTVGYWVAVTAFDYGSPASGLPSLESSKTVSGKFAYAQNTAAEMAEAGAEVFVYPNPYRIDSDYRGAAYEGSSQVKREQADDRVRAINFANVPPNCVVRIYSLDGDLVREIEHDVDPSEPDATHVEWDLVTRNTQLVVSGLYYWAVEDRDTGDISIGKLAIVM